MRTLLRALMTGTAVAALVLGGSSAALAASPTGNSASHDRYEFDDEWCFDYGSSYDCTTVDAALIVTNTPDGRDIARITYRQVSTSFDPNGVEIGSSRTVSFDRTVFAEGGQNDTFSVSHTRAVGAFGTCVTTYLLKIVDYELQIDKYAGPGCN